MCVSAFQREFEKEILKQVLPKKGTDSEGTESEGVCEGKQKKKKIRSHALIVSPQQTQSSMQNEHCTHFSFCSFTSGFTLKTENTTTWH